MKGKIVINKLKDKSGPKSEARISFAVFELQKGQAPLASEIIIKINSNKILIMSNLQNHFIELCF